MNLLFLAAAYWLSLGSRKIKPGDLCASLGVLAAFVLLVLVSFLILVAVTQPAP